MPPRQQADDHDGGGGGGGGQQEAQRQQMQAGPSGRGRGAPAPPRRTTAERLRARWRAFRAESSALYDALLWRELQWPALSLQWMPGAWAPPPGLQAAAEAAASAAAAAALERDALLQQPMDVDGDEGDGDGGGGGGGGRGRGGSPGAGGGGSGGRAPVVAPTQHRYLLLGAQTSGQAANAVLLLRVALPGGAPPGFDPARQRLLLAPGEIEPVLAVPHGAADVNRLAVHPGATNSHLFATASDAPEVLLFDLREQLRLQEQQQEQQQRRPRQIDGANGGGAEHTGDSGVEEEGEEGADDNDDDDDSDGDDDDDDGGEEPARPQAVLVGRAAGGFGLAWNPCHGGLLLGGDARGGVTLWDVGRPTSSGSQRGGGGSNGANGACRRVEPLHAQPHFAACAVNDVAWHRDGSLFGVATEDGLLTLADMRAPAAAAAAMAGAEQQYTGASSGSAGAGAAGGGGSRASSVSAAAAARLAGIPLRPQQQQQQQQQHAPRAAWSFAPRPGASARAHVRRGRAGGGPPAPPDCLSVAFDPTHAARLATGGADGCVCVWDLRRLARGPLERLDLHAGSVVQVAWSGAAPGLLASAGDDGHVLLWDAGRMRRPAGGGDAAAGGGGGEEEDDDDDVAAAMRFVNLGAAGSSKVAAAAPPAPPPAAAAAAASASQLGLPRPRPSAGIRAAVAALGAPPLLFAHAGHLAGLQAVALHPDAPWLCASASPLMLAPGAGGAEELVQPSVLQVWRPNTAFGLLNVS